ncbi:unnamed protein product [Owenia fusiformis]|uniref:Uncharacterized protein n=1 Tax=Owenia fusiformis TaxID=6347 RepID=A0A8J1XH68_OWEFU|nr:unnamed protein product [Owenia fusiformis]
METSSCLQILLFGMGIAVVVSSDHSFQGLVDSKQDGTFLDHFNDYKVTNTHIYDRRYKRDTATNKQEPHADSVKVALALNGRKIVLSLHQNRMLLGQNYIEKYYTDKGPVIRKKSNNTSHCFYHGELEGESKSDVAVSLCAGLRGYMSIGETVYYLHPSLDNPSSTIVIPSANYTGPDFKCGTDDSHHFNSHHHSSGHQRLKRRVRGPYDTNDKTRMIEMYIVNDYRQYVRHDKNVDVILERTKEIINIVTSMYRPLNIYVGIVGIEIWTTGDKITVTDSADDTLNNFVEYRKTDINPFHPNDNAQMLTGNQFTDGVVGKAMKTTICSFSNSAGVNMDSTDFIQHTATTVAHELGHNLGMEHDIESCKCKEDRCIMSATSGRLNPTLWSDCSVEYLEDTFAQGLDLCLTNVPEKLLDGAVCGNGFVEPGEECDCGLKKDCDNPCCNATTCRLHSNATCATGPCCNLKTCQLKPAATLCRKAKGPCDLAEHCWGNSEFCPDDVFKQDGSKCKDEAYCYQGQCQTREDQCKLLWGNTGRVANSLCYTYYNVKGSRNGNCGFNWTRSLYKPCLRKDVFCGMLHCNHENEKLMYWMESLSQHMANSELSANGKVVAVCKGAVLDTGLQWPDPGMVPTGAMCGDDQMCYKQQCRNISSLGFSSCPNGCHGNGVCNSKGNCHCNRGYAPPNCNTPGNGGSVESGPIELMPANNGLVAGLLVFFLLILPLLAIIGFCSYRHRNKLKTIWTEHSKTKYMPAKTTDIPMKKPSIKQDPPKRKPIVRNPSKVVEISKPIFESSTNKNPANTLPQGVSPPEATNAHKPSRPAPLRPKDGQPFISNPVPTPETIRTVSRQNSTDTNKVPPKRPARPPSIDSGNYYENTNAKNTNGNVKAANELEKSASFTDPKPPQLPMKPKRTASFQQPKPTRPPPSAPAGKTEPNIASRPKPNWTKTQPESSNELDNSNNSAPDNDTNEPRALTVSELKNKFNQDGALGNRTPVQRSVTVKPDIKPKPRMPSVNRSESFA